jgi:DNA-binding transcriptional LysR family regulator
MAQITLRQLEYFVAVADHGTVSGGAEAVRVSQSAMSSALAELERALGVTLLQRHRRGVTLAPGAAELLGRARTLLEQAEDLRSVAQETSTALHGPLRVGCYTTLAPQMIGSNVRAFLEDHPRIDLSFFEGSDLELAGALYEGRCDVAITYDYQLAKLPGSQRLTSVPLTAAPPRALIPPGHSLADGPVSLASLAEHPLILLDLHPAADYFLSFFRDRGLEPGVRFRTGSSQLVTNLVAEGLGCALLTQVPQGLSESRQGGPVIRELSDDLPALPVVALHPAGVQLSRRAAAFIAQCRRGREGRKAIA